MDWDPTLETGDPVVDEQHRGVVALINEIDDIEPDDTAGLLSVAERLMDHVETHFGTEEDLMRRGGYPAEAYEAHVREHQLLKEKARDAVLQFRSGAKAGKEPFVEFLRVWLVDHIETEDRKLVGHVKVSGAAARRPE